MNDLILGAGNLTISRFFALDGRTYETASVGLVVGGSIVIPHCAVPWLAWRNWKARPPQPETAFSRFRVSSTPAMISTAPMPCSGWTRSPSSTHAAAEATSGTTHM